MKTEIQDSTLDAFKEIKNNRTIEGRHLEVYRAISKMGACSNSMIADYLKLNINQVTGRTNELRNYFKVVGFAKKDICPITKRMVIFWKVVKCLDDWNDLKKGVVYGE